MDTDKSLEIIKENNNKAENLVKFLEKEISLLKKAAADKGLLEKANQLKEENALLKKEVELWKQRVIELEILNGIPQYHLPSETKNNNSKKENLKIMSENSTSFKINNEEVKQLDENLTAGSSSTFEKEEPKNSKKQAKVVQKKPIKKENHPKDDNKNVDVSRLDFRIGRIISAKKHPDAESLYVEEIDVGEAKPRIVVSGLVKFVPLEEMQNRLVVVLCNLKPVKMRGITSEAMVMCASTPEKVEILCPPENSIPGDKVICEDYPGEPDSILPPKKKIFEQVAPDLKTNIQCIATYKASSLKVIDKGLIKSKSLADVQIK